MNFETIQKRIATKIEKVNAEIKKIEALDLDYTTPQAARLDARMRVLSENADFLEMLAFFIYNQDEEITVLQEQLYRANNRIAALLTISERGILRTNTAQATLSLLQSKLDYVKRETEDWVKQELGESDYKLLNAA